MSVMKHNSVNEKDLIITAIAPFLGIWCICAMLLTMVLKIEMANLVEFK
jgi:hypothetical protein